MKVGLTLGKFAPLHKGHQLLIEKAFSENDHVIVMVYDSPDFTSVPLPTRSGWIKSLYPSVEVIEAWDGPMEVSDAPDIKQRHEQYILSKLKGRKITHFYSSEFYGDHVSKALGAVDRRIDPERGQIRISGTAIRKDPFAHRHHLSSVVYRDLITRVVFLGAPSTGKTTLVEQFAKAYSTVWMPEYGREYWEKHQNERRLSLEQLVEIAEGHREREERLMMDARNFLFIDTDATTTHMFSLYYHGKAHPRLAELARDTLKRYDLFFLCGDEIPYHDTWDRSGEVNRAVFQKQIRADLLERKIPFISLKGSLEERMEKVANTLKGFDKFSSFGDNLTKKQP